MRRLRLNALLGGVLLVLLAGIAVLAAVWTPYAPLAINLRLRLAPPSALHWFGTDQFGRDVLSRVMRGASTSVTVAVLTVLAALIGGIVIGIVAGYARGWTDRVLMALTDTLLAFPGILLAMAVLVITGGGQWSIIAALGIAYTPTVARVVRGAVLSVRQRDYVEASRMIGNSMLRHVLPNCLSAIIVLATAMLGWVLLAESALSFLGLGVPPPAPSWGNMLAASRPYMASSVWLELAPGCCIAVTLLAVNMLGDALRDWLDPRSR
jgi:peptide/nickel transport system permease protein